MYNRSRSLACSNLLATPRDALTFLYPAFHFRTPRATHWTTNAQAHIIEQPEHNGIPLTDSHPLPTGVRLGPEKRELTKQLCSGEGHDQTKLCINLAQPKRIREKGESPPANDEDPTDSTSQKGTLLETTVAHNSSQSAFGHVQREGEKQQTQNPLANDDNPAKSKSLKEALLGSKGSHNNSGLPVRLVPTKLKMQRKHSDPPGHKARGVVLGRPTAESIQETLELTPITIRRLRSQVRKMGELRDGAVIEEKGSWSYDWRQPLDELKLRYRADGSDASLIPLDRPYLLPKRPKYHEVRAQDIPLPALWSTSSCVEYVQDLTQSKVSRVYNSYIYHDGMTHVDAVHDALMHVFEDSSLRPYLIPKAFDIALVYFYKHLDIPSVRRLYNLMNELHMEIAAGTFTIMLKGAAANKDLYHLTYILRYMARKGVSPNAESWVALLRAVQSDRAKLVIYREMKEAGVLAYPATLQNAVAEILDVELTSHITGGQELASFLQQLDTKYGPNWLSLSAVNHLCHRLGENGLVSQAMEVLKLATDQNIRPDSISLHIFLSHSLRLRRPKLAIQIVELFHSEHKIHPDEAAYDVLFMVAFRAQRLQLCKVIWRYACLNGAVSFRMEQIVTRSLLRNTPEHPKTNLRRWLKTAGKAIVGIDFGVEKWELKSMTHPTGWEIMAMLSEWAATGDERERAIRLARKVVKRDLNAWRRYVPRFTLVPMLKSALYRDSQWEEQGKRDAPVLWKVKNSIRVQIRVPSVKELERQDRLSEWKARRFGNHWGKSEGEGREGAVVSEEL